NMGGLRCHATLREFDINQRPIEIAEAVLSLGPKIIGFGVYIWNVSETTEVVSILKRVQPDIQIILGGPEVSYETEEQQIVELADYVITGEGDLKFGEVCEQLLHAETPSAKIIPAPLPEFSQ